MKTSKITELPLGKGSSSQHPKLGHKASLFTLHDEKLLFHYQSGLMRQDHKRLLQVFPLPLNHCHWKIAVQCSSNQQELQNKGLQSRIRYQFCFLRKKHRQKKSLTKVFWKKPSTSSIIHHIVEFSRSIVWSYLLHCCFGQPS